MAPGRKEPAEELPAPDDPGGAETAPGRGELGYAAAEASGPPEALVSLPSRTPLPSFPPAAVSSGATLLARDNVTSSTFPPPRARLAFFSTRSRTVSSTFGSERILASRLVSAVDQRLPTRAVGERAGGRSRGGRTPDDAAGARGGAGRGENAAGPVDVQTVEAVEAARKGRGEEVEASGTRRGDGDGDGDDAEEGEEGDADAVVVFVRRDEDEAVTPPGAFPGDGKRLLPRVRTPTGLSTSFPSPSEVSKTTTEPPDAADKAPDDGDVEEGDEGGEERRA